MNEFVKYLNGLHNYSAQNQNAYSERNIESPYYKKTMVTSDICNYIVSSINNNIPHIIILTGHAGDGKTSILFQVLEQLSADVSYKDPIQNVLLDDGKIVCCIKDFSELSDKNKLKVLSEVISYPNQGKYVFMVANTGPLINTFGELFEGKEEREEAKMALIETMDSNDGEIKNLFGYKMMVINIAAIENASFAKSYLDKLLNPEQWAICDGCSNKKYCHIIKNHDLIMENIDRVKEFIEFFYIWLNEYGTRLTIRSITEQLAYMITGGYDCSEIHPSEIHDKLFFNLFFGYEGLVSNPLADNVLAIRIAKDSNLYIKRLRADEELLIRRNYQKLFGKSINEILETIDTGTRLHGEFDNELRRMYLFASIVPEEQHKKDLEDIFSKQFLPYLSVKNDEKKPTKAQKSLVIDALRMIYTGTVINTNNTIPITMGTEDGITQSVQLIAGVLNTGDIDLITVDDSVLNKDQKNMVLRVKRKNVCILTLPMVDHFEELKNGVIATNMDPQLSRGIENIKSRLLELSDTDDDRLEFLVMDNKGFSEESIVIEDGAIILQ